MRLNLLHKRRSFVVVVVVAAAAATAATVTTVAAAARVACRGSAKVSGPKITVTNPPYTEVFERGYPPRETVPAFFQSKMNWIIREDTRGCKFLHRVREREACGDDRSPVFLSLFRCFGRSFAVSLCDGS